MLLTSLCFSQPELLTEIVVLIHWITLLASVYRYHYWPTIDPITLVHDCSVYHV